MKTLINTKKIITTLMLGGLLTQVIGFSFAQSLPDYDQNRVIEDAETLLTSSDGCNPYQSLAFYEDSDVYFRLLSEPLSSTNRRIEDNSIAYKYGNVFSDGLRIPFISNIQPKLGTTGLGSDNKILITESEGSTFDVPDGYSTARDQIAGQLVTKNYYRMIYDIPGSDADYFFTKQDDTRIDVTIPTQVTAPTQVEKIACLSYYVAYCGDGVVDVESGDETTDGQGGIDTADDGFITWHSTSSTPSEQCDDGNNTDGDGCSATCQNEAGSPPTCTLTLSSDTTNVNSPVTVNWSINGNYTNSPSITANPTTVTGLPHSVTTANGNTSVTPTAQGSYTLSMNVSNEYGSNNCTDTLTVNPVPTTDIWTTKTLLDDRTYSAGEEVGFRIAFGNNGSQTGTDIRILDILPTSISYVSSQINITATGPIEGQIGTNQTVEYNGFELAPGAQGEIILTGRISDFPVWTDTTNYARVYSSGSLQDESMVIVLGTPEEENVSIFKSSNKETYYPGETIRFILNISNGGSMDTARNITIKDVWPESCVDYKYTVQTPSHVHARSLVNPYERRSTANLNPGDSYNVVLEGEVQADCMGAYTNTGILEYDIMDTHYTKEWVAAFRVIEEPYSDIEITKEANIDSAEPGDEIEFTIEFTNNGNSSINEIEITDIWPNTMDLRTNPDYEYSGPGNPTYTKTPINGGLELRWTITDTVLSPGQTGTITLIGIVK